MKALFLIVPNGFRDEEYAEPKKVLEQAGFQVITASKVSGILVGKLGKVTANVDILISQAKAEDYDAILIAGGQDTFWHDPEVLGLIKDFNNAEKVIGAICISGALPAQAGIMQGKRSTVFATEASLAELKRHGAIYTGEPVTIAGKIVTANGPAAAEEFGQEIVQLLKK